MCGLCGVVRFRTPLEDEPTFLQRVNCLAHRGPDDVGVHRDGLCALGHRRLSIIDLQTGRQPLANEDQSVWLVCNGEIYNYRELTRDLRAKGHRFATRSDSEVIVHLYEEYGEACVTHLNGIFAFALWDAANRKLLLARDHLGVKPLFYLHDGGRFLFGSEIKAILRDPGVDRELDADGIFHYLSLNYIPSPLTPFRKVRSLPAGHWLALREGELRIERYWDVSFRPHSSESEAELTERLREQLDRSVERQLVSDVPVGAFLSGGLDSSSIVEAMRRKTSGDVDTFNVGFAESSFDESSHARLVARELGTRHHEIRCEASDYLRWLPDIVWHADNLTCDISMLPLYLVSKLAREHVKVVLSGDGADELFAGYPTYLADRAASVYRRLPAFLRDRALPSLVARLPVSSRKMSWDFLARRFVEGARLSPEEAHFSWRTIFSDADKAELLAKDVRDCVTTSSFWSYERHYDRVRDLEDPLARHQYADIKVWLVDSILAKVDSMSMAHALEVRVPFLDRDLVEFASGLPPDAKLRGTDGKHLLKVSARGRLPESIRTRAKAGFQIPIDTWLRTSLRELLLDLLSDASLRQLGLFDVGTVHRLVDDHLRGRQNHGYRLLGLMHFCLWHEQFVSGSGLNRSERMERWVG